MEDNIGKGLDCIKICYYNHTSHITLTERLVILFSSVLKTPGCFGVLLCDGDGDNMEIILYTRIIVLTILM